MHESKMRLGLDLGVDTFFANILNKLPKSQQKKAKENIHKIWMAPTRTEAEKSFDSFLKIYEAKCPGEPNALKKIAMSF